MIEIILTYFQIYTVLALIPLVFGVVLSVNDGSAFWDDYKLGLGIMLFLIASSLVVTWIVYSIHSITKWI